MKNGKLVLTDRVKPAVVQAMEDYFGQDARRIGHALRVAEYAEELLKYEPGDYPVVIMAALLHDIGIHMAERKFGSTAGGYQEQEGPPIARDILSKLGFPAHQVEEVCQIIAHHHSPGVIDTVNFKVLYDADWLVNLREEYPTSDKSKLATVIEKLFLTGSGKDLAREIYLRD